MAIDRDWEKQLTYKSIDKVYTYGVNIKNSLDDTNTYVNATEWGNGEGIDLFVLKDKKEEAHISLSYEEAYAVLHVLEMIFDKERMENAYYARQYMLNHATGAP